MKFTVEQAQSAQGSALVQAELFREYSYTETPGQKDSFQIPLSSTKFSAVIHIYTHALTHCLHSMFIGLD